MSATESPLLYYMLLVLVISWLVISFVATVYALVVTFDSRKDIKARHESNINSGREAMAQLVYTMGRLKLFAFSVWFLCGIYAMSPWALPGNGPPWKRLIIPLGLDLGMIAVAASLVNFQRERARVLKRDMDDKQLRVEAAAIVTALHLEDNTNALRENTKITKDAITALHRAHGTEENQ